MGLLDDANAVIDSSFAISDNIRDLKVQQDLDSLNVLAEQKALKDSSVLSPNTLVEAFLSNKSNAPLGSKQDLTVLTETLNPGTNYGKAKHEAKVLFNSYIAKNVVGSPISFANPERKGGNVKVHDLGTYINIIKTPDAVEMGNLKQIFLKKTLKHINPDRYHWGQQVPILGMLAYNKTQGLEEAQSHVPWVKEQFESMNTYIKSVNKVRAFEGHEPIGLFDKDEVMTYYLDMTQNNKMRSAEINKARHIDSNTVKADSLQGAQQRMHDLFVNFIPKNELGSSYTSNGRSSNDSWFNEGHGSEYGSVKRDNVDVIPGSTKTFTAETVKNVDWLDPTDMVETKYKNFQLVR